MMKTLIALFKEVKLAVFMSVYLSFFLDNVLLTVVVPIIPDYLFSTLKNVTANKGATSLSPLQRKFEELEKQNGPLGVLLASKAFVQLAFTPIVGYLTGIIGYQLPLLLGNINMLIASILFAYGNTYGVLVLARALHGSSSAAIAVSGMSILAECVPPKPRSKIMPVAFGGIALGVLIGYPLGGAAYELMGKSAPFLLVALLVAANIGVIFWQLRRDETHIISQVTTTNSNADSGHFEWTEMFRNKSALIAAGAICISTSCMAILEPCVPMWLLANISPPPTKWQLGAVFIPDSLGYFVGSHFAGLLPLAPWKTALIGMLSTGFGACSIPLAATIGQLTIPHFGIGLGVGIVDAALLPFLANLVDAHGGGQYGPVYALQQMAVSVAYSLGPLVGGEAVQSIGFLWLMRLAGLLNVLYTPLLLELEGSIHQENGYILRDESLPSYSSFDRGAYQDCNW